MTQCDWLLETSHGAAAFRDEHPTMEGGAHDEQQAQARAEARAEARGEARAEGRGEAMPEWLLSAAMQLGHGEAVPNMAMQLGPGEALPEGVTQSLVMQSARRRPRRTQKTSD